MGFRNNAFATVWEVKPRNERWTKIRISISRKDQQTGDYETEFSGWVDVYGTIAAAKAAKLKERDRIKLSSVDLTNSYNAEAKTTYWNPKIFGFEMADGADSTGHGGGGGRQQQRQQQAYEGENEADEFDEGLPF